MAKKSSEAQAPTKAQAGGITKTAAVTQALATLGRDAMPMQIKGFIKDKFGIEMTNNAISTYKGEINRKAASSATPATPAASEPAAPASKVKKKPGPKPQVKLAPVPGSNGNAGGIGLPDIQAVKELVGRVGPQNLKTLIDVLTK